MTKSPMQIVREYYPDAKAVNVGTKSGGKFYHIMNGNIYLAKGKSSKAAWKSAMRNI